MPSGLCRASELQYVAIANHHMEGAIPRITSTLSLLALHKNRLQVLPNLHLVNSASATAILLHDNLLSCHVPWCRNASVRTSVIAIGNRLQYPKREFPQWVSKYEQDPLLWISGVEGVSMLKQISGAVVFFMLVMAWKLGAGRWLRTISRWQIGPTADSWLLQALFHLISCLVKESLLAAVFLMFLLFWDLYACPETLAIASACLRNSALVRASVFLCWCQLSFHSLAKEYFMMEGKNLRKQWTAKTLRKRLMLWMLWCLLTVAFSIVASLYQVGRSIPGFLSVGRIWSLGLKGGIGTVQGVVGTFIMPALASRVTWDKHAFTTVSNLIMNCLIPTVIVMYLDTGCLGRWVALWKPCRSNRQLFQHSLICNTQNEQDCGDADLFDPVYEIDFGVVRASDICDPHYSWSFTSMSSCMQTSLLRLQEVVLGKLITTGVVIPGIAFLRDSSEVKTSGEVLAKLAIYMAYAMVSSGHLPLMMPLLLLAVCIAGLLAVVAWAQRGILPVHHAQNIAAPVLRMTRLLSLIVHLASAAGDTRALAMAAAYISMLILANGIGRQGRPGVEEKRRSLTLC